VIIDGTNGLTFPDNSRQYNGYFGFKNRIINGDMRIDQRNAGAAVTVNSTSEFFAVDRFVAQGQPTDGVFTIQRSTVAPAGFTNSLLATVTTADSSIGSTQYYFLQQKIEGFNVADLAWGTASAQTVTVSFWVRSSLTGTFAGSLVNDGATRSYPFTYTISAANTWEQKSVTIPGDTTGTWLTNNGIGLRVYFNIGAGSSYTTTAGAWASQWAFNVTGATNLIATNGATLQITGVQLEEGVVSTNFDVLPYGTQLSLCQRYYWKLFPNDASRLFGAGQCFTTTAAGVQIPFEVQMRTRPTALEQSATASHYKILNSAGGDVVCSAVPTYNAVTTDYMAWVALTVASGIVAGNGTTCLTNNAAAYLAWSAEL
jgi:hypothetical protein